LKEFIQYIYKAKAHCIGFGEKDAQIAIRTDDLEGESTLKAEIRGKQIDFSYETMNIGNLTAFLQELNYDNIDVLHMNCDGCEWELMESLVDSGEI
jgi:hypothetical protein